VFRKSGEETGYFGFCAGRQTADIGAHVRRRSAEKGGRAQPLHESVVQESGIFVGDTFYLHGEGIAVRQFVAVPILKRPSDLC